MPYQFTSLSAILCHPEKDGRTLVDQTISTDTVFCRSLVSEGYLTEQQMLHAADRYRLGRSKDGAVIFWEIDEQQQIRDGKLMYYHDNCHRDKDRNATWVTSLLKRQKKPIHDIRCGAVPVWTSPVAVRSGNDRYCCRGRENSGHLLGALSWCCLDGIGRIDHAQCR